MDILIHFLYFIAAFIVNFIIGLIPFIGSYILGVILMCIIIASLIMVLSYMRNEDEYRVNNIRSSIAGSIMGMISVMIYNAMGK